MFVPGPERKQGNSLRKELTWRHHQADAPEKRDPVAEEL